MTTEKKNIKQVTVLAKGKYEFSNIEKQKMGQELALKYKDKQSIQDEFQSVKSQFKDRQDRVELNINTLSRNINDGYELRDFECTMEKDFDAHLKRFRDVRTKKIISEVPLDPSDYQGRFV